MWRLPKWTRLTESLRWPQSFVLLLLPCLLALTLYFLSGSERELERVQYLAWRSYNTSVADVLDGYLVWNSKCHMLSMNPYDPSIVKFVKREKFEACSTKPKLTSIGRYANGSVYLLVDRDAAKRYKDLSCCWAPVVRPSALLKLDKEYDSRVSVGHYEDFEEQVLLNKSIEVVHVVCRTGKSSRKPSASKVKTAKAKSSLAYENVHAVLNPERVRERWLNASENRAGYNNTNGTVTATAARHAPLSVLLLGVDSVSRLNFYRAMPATRAYFEDRGWTELRGYNKMGDNTFPNLMALLTGQNQTWAYAKCKPKALYGLDNCSMIWYNFREAGYVTAYAEDQAKISTFNYLKMGFVEPPTDYYLRPYILAAEKLLKTQPRFSSNHCTGPELSIDRIFDSAVEFAKAFVGSPYFGFFWSNTISHENMNGLSLYDTRFLAKLRAMEDAGVMNDSMIVVLSDHGMRYGNIRDTFVGWYEERLPFVYVWLPEWFREQNPESALALRVNQNRLSSPYDLYETLRDVLQRAGGQAPASTGCPRCSSLLKPLPRERGCKEAGIAPHWCTCAAFEPISSSDSVVVEGANKFVDHMENIVKQYKNKKGDRVCSQPKLKRIIRVKKMLDLEGDPQGKALKLLYLLEVTPGGGKFETTMTYNGPGNYTIRDEEVSRINLYGHSAKCLSEGFKQYCHCGVWHSISDHLFGR
ncbi:uncharacterized protein LOC131663201 isoform X2 [Phymastichus coffea]|uniref:uncharacterized protein LOC131663201 isoform X2 n=1 Tax=Phymastichus coffea TaxID=108790 RepID=UPI00273AB7CF|nr:uncharacterized protein LOC131663201 isoform X2 [Phymastichus coffea]